MSTRNLIRVFIWIAIFHFSVGQQETNEQWITMAKEDLERSRQVKPIVSEAKNIIFFLGDGMGVSTVTAARILKGQLNNKSGEEQILSFEMFPHVALIKTYNQNAQTPDSSGTATALFSGIKTNAGVVGLDARSRRADCSTKNGTELQNILDWSKAAGKSVGMVTTTRITHATPASLYAHSPERDWESDANVRGGCKDIAAQLIDDNLDINVILGGGREKFLSNNDLDPESGNITNGRKDGRNLIDVWQQKQQELGRAYKYVWNQTSFEAVVPAETDYLLGLFNKDHMNFELERHNDKAGEPSLAEMAKKAIQILSKNTKGYFLLVEGGRIDHGHHYSQAKKALHDTLAFDEAVNVAVRDTSDSDTLIIVTADHSHVFTIGGYPTRGNPILGFTDDQKGKAQMADDKKPFTTVSYANGPGAYATTANSSRPNNTAAEIANINYKQQSAVPLNSETHGGEDVAIYARGPMAYLFHGVHEQHYVGHVMAYAFCVGNYTELCSNPASQGYHLTTSGFIIVISLVLVNII